jgi:signal transduction histidine kinase/ActR/RegA family two-component response regulator
MEIPADNKKRSDRPRVLVVTRDSSVFDPLRDALEVCGVESRGAGSASAAFTELARREYEAVVLDADGFPGDWAGVVARIRRRRPDPLVFVAAARPSKTLVNKLLHAGSHHFLPKPMDGKATARLIRAACDKRGPAGGPQPAEGRGAAGDDRARGGRSVSREFLAANQQLQNANETLRRQVSQLTILYQMGRDISENENWSDALDRFLMALVNYAEAEGAALLLFSRGGERLAARSNFQVDEDALGATAGVLGARWRENPRGFEIHAAESYTEPVFNACLERLKPWRLTVVPLRYRSRVWGFLVIEKRYRSNARFRQDYPFFTTIQTILAEEVANASYISDLRQLSRFNQKVLDNIQSGVITTDLEGQVIFWNHVASEMCPSLGGNARVHFDRLFRSREHPEGLFAPIMKSDTDTRVLEVTYAGALERESPARLSITKMHDDGLNGTVFVGIFEDLTEQKKLEAELRRMDRLRVLGQLSAGVAHEIRNPLTGIATSAEVLGSRLGANEDKRKYVTAILDETRRLDGIVRNLLSYAKPARPRFGPCAAGEVAGRVVGLLADQAGKKGIEVTVRDELGGRLLHADADQLTQVLINLVLNAIEACDEGSTVEISLAVEPDAGRPGSEVVRLDVRDDGPGIAAEVRDRLFEPFVSTKTQGTGLGLAISQQIIEEHDGTIECECGEEGTRFTIRLPIGADAAAPAERSR